MKIKNFLFYKFFRSFFIKQIQQETEDSAKLKASYMVDDYKKNKNEERHRNKIWEIEAYIGKPVICFSNEWETPVIGFGVKVDYISMAQDPVLVVHDYITNKDYIILGSSFHYTQQIFDTTFKLTPFEMCNILYNTPWREKEFSKQINHEILTREEVIEKLNENGFYDRLTMMNSVIEP